MADLTPLDALKQRLSPGSVGGLIRDRNAMNDAAAASTDSGSIAPAGGLPPGAPMVQGVASPMELAVRAKTKAAQDARLQQLLRTRGANAVAPPVNAPIINGTNLIQ